MNEFSDKRIWITGASLGIGRALAIELAERGATLALTARGEEQLAELRDELAERGSTVHIFPGDVTDLDRMKAVERAIRDDLGGIDMLIANAGTHRFSKPEQFDTAEYLSLMNLNYGGTLRCIEAVLPEMLNRRAGHIVGVASLAGYRGLPRAAAYSASKGALINFLQSIRFHLARHNIAVTIVNPGFVRTPLTDRNDFHMPFLVEPDAAARTICNGLARRKKEIAFPFLFASAIRLMRILPYPLYEWIMNRVWSRMNVQ